jgi:uncharacterized protein (TIGR02246 family)
MRFSSILVPLVFGVLSGLAVVSARPVSAQDQAKDQPVTVAPKPAAPRSTPAPKEPSAKVAKPATKNEAPKTEALENADPASPETDSEAPVAPRTEAQRVDEAAIRTGNLAFAQAYAKGDAKAAAEHFTADAEYVDERGVVFEGRKAIEQSLDSFFAENPDCRLDVEIASIRFVGPGLAIEDGITRLTLATDEAVVESPYTAIHVKVDGRWHAASIRDHAPKDRRQHRSHLKQLDWLLGDWIDEGDESLVTFSCDVSDKGNFLMRKFSIVVSGQEAMSGTQRIGWDPLTGKLRVWIFDSEGGYGEGLWHQGDGEWVLKLTGVTAEGEPTSSTSIYTLVNGHTMTWQTVDHEIAGVQLPDSEIITIVRQAPAPVVVIDDK